MNDSHWQARLDSAAAGARTLTDNLNLRRGTIADYHALAPFHYLRQRPATASRVLVLEHLGHTAATRFRNDPPEQQVVAVLVESMPVLGSAMRNVALRDRYRGLKGDRYWAGRLVNHDLRCISRVIVHPQWRGLGLAVRIVREALATMTTPYTEAIAAMGRVHPFFERAGMQPYPRWPLPKDQRLRDALHWAGVELWQLASTDRMRQHVQRDRTGLLRRELSRWAGRNHRTLDAQLHAARTHLLCEPIYYLKARQGG